MSVCGIETASITASSRGAYNRAVADLREVGATQGQVVLRAKKYRERWPSTSLTPTALAKHWAELDAAASAPQPENGERCPKHKRQPLTNCQICDSEKRGAA